MSLMDTDRTVPLLGTQLSDHVAPSNEDDITITEENGGRAWEDP